MRAPDLKQACLCERARVCMHACVRACMCVNACVCPCVCVCACACTGNHIQCASVHVCRCVPAGRCIPTPALADHGHRCHAQLAWKSAPRQTPDCDLINMCSLHARLPPPQGYVPDHRFGSQVIGPVKGKMMELDEAMILPSHTGERTAQLCVPGTARITYRTWSAGPLLCCAHPRWGSVCSCSAALTGGGSRCSRVSCSQAIGC